MIFKIIMAMSLWATVNSICPKDCYCSEGMVECSLVMEFPLNLNPDTTKLKIAQMNIGAIPRNAFSYLPRLQEVEFVQGNVREIAGCAFMDMPSIDTIKFEKTNIARINSYAFFGLDNVTNIVFANSKLGYLESFAFYQLNNVVTFNVLYSAIDYLSAGSFYDVQSVSVLLFSNNNISDVITGAFSDVTTENFHVMTNTFWNMDCGVFNGMNQSSSVPFEFIGNTFYCNCSIEWLLNDEGKSQYGKFMGNNKCHGPSSLKTKVSLKDVAFNELGCKRRTADQTLECSMETLVPKPRCKDLPGHGGPSGSDSGSDQATGSDPSNEAPSIKNSHGTIMLATLTLVLYNLRS
ncbi:Leucine-rich repeat-containing protein 3 [Mactra antiquata]